MTVWPRGRLQACSGAFSSPSFSSVRGLHRLQGSGGRRQPLHLACGREGGPGESRGGRREPGHGRDKSGLTGMEAAVL
jgi:hypothetical protein